MMKSVLPSVDGPADRAIPYDFDEFYGSTVESTIRIVRRFFPNDAYDLVQEAYAAMLQRWPDRCRYSAEDNRSYLAATARNLVIDRFRLMRRRWREIRFDESMEIAVVDTGLDEVHDRHSIFKAVRDKIDEQSPRRRVIGILFFLYEYEPSEIARMLSITASTVRSTIQYLRGHLRPLAEELHQLERGDGRQ